MMQNKSEFCLFYRPLPNAHYTRSEKIYIRNIFWVPL
jgi:hypothetical protein